MTRRHPVAAHSTTRLGLIRTLPIVAVALLAAACAREPEVREYDEVVIKTSPVAAAFDGSGAAMAGPGGGAVAAGATANPLKWQTPSTWQELPGDSIRLATFLLERGGARAETTVVMLGGAAGGVEANVVRWLDQLGLSLPADELAAFLSAGEPVSGSRGLRLTLYDFTSLPAPQGVSMLVAVGPVLDQTLFVKMSGDGSLVAAARSDFVGLVRSLGLNGGSGVS